MSEIDKFRNTMSPSIDGVALRQDILTKLINDYSGRDNTFTTAELTRHYYGYADFETKWFIEHQLQLCRKALEDNGLFLVNERGHWYLAKAQEEAKGHLNERAGRFVRAGRRLQNTAKIAVENYGLPSGDRVVQAIRGAEPVIQQIEESRKELPEGKEEQE